MSRSEKEKDPNRCEVAVYFNFRDDQCDYRHKYDVMVRTTPNWKGEAREPFEVKVCGTHKRHLEKGHRDYVITGKWRRESPCGFDTDAVELAPQEELGERHPTAH